MGLGNHPIAAEVVGLRGEVEPINPATQAGEFDGELDLPGIDRLVLAVSVNVKLRIHAVFEDRHLDGEISVPKHAAAVRPALVVRSRGCAVLGALRRLLFPILTGCEESGGRDHQRKARQPIECIGVHQRRSAVEVEGEIPAWRPVRRSRAAWSMWY